MRLPDGAAKRWTSWSCSGVKVRRGRLRPALGLRKDLRRNWLPSTEGEELDAAKLFMTSAHDGGETRPCLGKVRFL
jgi:hypothetical protein